MAVIDSYSESNSNGQFGVGDDFTSELAQSFTGDGSDVNSTKFELEKSGSPTGNITVYLYAHTGTYGTSSLPTGAALITSDTVDISTISTKSLIEFTFSTGYTTTNGTKYVISIVFSGDSSNYLLVSSDTSSPTHDGNLSYDADGWTSVSAWDLCFYVLSADSSNIASINGVTQANIKSINTITEANIKSVGGVDN